MSEYAFRRVGLIMSIGTGIVVNAMLPALLKYFVIPLSGILS